MSSVICDLDGVVYSGPEALPGAPEALRRMVEAGVAVWFATNNSTRTPRQVVNKIGALTSVAFTPSRVITSAQAAISLIDVTSGPVFVVGGDGIREALREASIAMTVEPLEAKVVIVGFDPSVSYQSIADAAAAIRNGARFIATNDDATYPTPSGPLPGTGAIVAAIATAAQTEPTVAGKPYAPMRELLRARAGDQAWVIGDRVETDIAMAEAMPGWTPILVLSGVTGADPIIASDGQVVPGISEAVDIVLNSRGRQ